MLSEIAKSWTQSMILAGQVREKERDKERQKELENECGKEAVVNAEPRITVLCETTRTFHNTWTCERFIFASCDS